MGCVCVCVCVLMLFFKLSHLMFWDKVKLNFIDNFFKSFLCVFHHCKIECFPIKIIRIGDRKKWEHIIIVISSWGKQQELKWILIIFYHWLSIIKFERHSYISFSWRIKNEPHIMQKCFYIYLKFFLIIKWI